jgi:hypothetical protein
MRQENRKNVRLVVQHGARIALADGTLTPCRMFDLSATGACLQLNAAEAMPENFILLLSHDGKLRRQCAVVWRSKKQIGVEFIPEFPMMENPSSKRVVRST